MDDCNYLSLIEAPSDYLVQIPLWTIVTGVILGNSLEQFSSDSSMDDCNSQTAQVEAGSLEFRFLYGRL